MISYRSKRGSEVGSQWKEPTFVARVGLSTFRLNHPLAIVELSSLMFNLFILLVLVDFGIKNLLSAEQ